MTIVRTASYQALGGIGEAPILKEELYDRVKMLRSWMHDTDWQALCRAHPPAIDWFDDVGEPK